LVPPAPRPVQRAGSLRCISSSSARTSAMRATTFMRVG
jgi:hypothetical protein